jgi:hypothetical protein
MNDLAKALIIVGGITLCIGLCIMLISKIPGIGKLPGDIIIKKENVIVYFPLMTCIVISILLSLFFYLFRR